MRRLHIILVWYFCVFLLFSGLLLLPYLFIYRYIADVTLRNELAAVSQSMEQGMTAFDSCVKVLNNIVITADGDPDFTRLKPGTFKTQARLNPAALKDMRDIVNMALLPFLLPLDSGFLFPGGEAVTRKSVFPYPGSVPFYGAFFRTDALSREDWTATKSRWPETAPTAASTLRRKVPRPLAGVGDNAIHGVGHPAQDPRTVVFPSALTVA